VGYAVWIGDILRIDSAAQTFSTSFVVAMRWHDPKLAHSGPGAKQYALDDIWHPRFLIGNEAEESFRSLPEIVEVAPDGTAVYRQRVVGAFSQSLNLRAFPFDSDTFRLLFVVPGARPADIQFAPDETAVSMGMRDGVGLAEKLHSARLACDSGDIEGAALSRDAQAGTRRFQYRVHGGAQGAPFRHQGDPAADPHRDDVMGGLLDRAERREHTDGRGRHRNAHADRLSLCH
jgi:hypothetical protein